MCMCVLIYIYIYIYIYDIDRYDVNRNVFENVWLILYFIIIITVGGSLWLFKLNDKM